MSAARAWLLRKVARRRLPALDDALLTQRGVMYTWFRLALVYQRAILRTLVHAAELWLMSREFPFEFAVPLFTIRATFGLASGLSWGPLEALRRSVREQMRHRCPGRAQRIIEAWLVLATLTGLLPLAWAAWLVLPATEMEWAFDGLYGSYFLISALCLLIELRTRTVYSGVFALGRVYRPTWSVIGPDLLELALLVGCWNVLGPFALGFALLVTSPLRAKLTTHFALKAYRVRKLERPSAIRVRSLARLERKDLALAARGLLSAVPSQLDRLLVVMLLRAPALGLATIPLSAPYYALRPLASVAQSWARTYYADFVRLDRASVSLLRSRFERLLRRATLEAALLAGASLVLGAWFLLGREGALASLWFLPLLAVRSHLALVQVKAVAYERDDALLRISLLMVLVLGVASMLEFDDRYLVTSVAVGLALAASAFGDVGSVAQRRAVELSRRLSLSAWLSQLSKQAEPVRLHVVRVDTKLARTGAVRIRVLTDPRVRCITTFGRAWLLWWEDAELPTDRPALAALLSGTCQSHRSCEANSGALVLEAARTRHVLPRELAAVLSLPGERDGSIALTARFKQVVPSGQIIDLLTASAQLVTLSRGELGLVRRALVAEVRGLHVVPRNAPWQVAVYAPHGEVQVVYVWPAHTIGGAAFRRAVVEESWRQSVSGSA